MLFFHNKLLRIITFPGVIMHEVAHRILCDMFAVRVYAIQYFSSNIHTKPIIYNDADIKHTYQQFLIAYAPLIINTMLGMVFTFPFIISQNQLSISIYIPNIFIRICWYITYWIGFSFLYNAIPKKTFLENIKTEKLPIPILLFHNSILILTTLAHINYISFFVRLLYICIFFVIL